MHSHNCPCFYDGAFWGMGIAFVMVLVTALAVCYTRQFVAAIRGR